MQPPSQRSHVIPVTSSNTWSLTAVLSIARELTKLKLTSMATVPAVLAFLAASSGSGLGALLLLALGVFASASGAAALNQWSERRIDARMNRTRGRPLPAGKLSSSFVLINGLALVLGGVLILALMFNLFSALLALAAAVVYWLIYTPLKRVTPWCTEVGAIAGALPPLIGWAAAHNSLSLFAWFLFVILFLWQMPHFHPIAWRYRQDYLAGGLRMRVLTEHTGNQAANHAIGYASVLILLPVGCFIIGEIGAFSLITAVVMGGVYLRATTRFRFCPNRDQAARRLFRVSLIYLPIVLAAFAADRTFHGLL